MTNLLPQTPALLDDPAWQEGKTRLIINGRHRDLAKTRDLAFKDLANTRVHRVDLRYRDESSRVLEDQDFRKCGSFEKQACEAAAHQGDEDNVYLA